MTNVTPLAALIQFREDTAEPLYSQLERQLRLLIDEGRLPQGATLPAERLMAEMLGISRTTVKRGYAVLSEAGLIRARGRLGYTVEGVPTARLDPGLDRLKGFTEEMRELGRTPSSNVLECAPTEDRAIASIFGLSSTTSLLKLERVRCGDGTPLSHELAWYNLDAVPQLVDIDPTGSIYAQLHDLGAKLATCEQWIEAAMPTKQECEIFGFAQPIPCLLIKRKSYDATGRMIEYVEGLFRGDSYAYRLKMNV